MKHRIWICFAIVLVILLSGCSDDTQQAELENLKTQLAAYEKYHEFITAMEASDYDTAEELLEALKLQDYSENLAEGNVQEVAITTENWNQYFELREITQWQQNGSGAATGFITHVCLVLKSEFVDSVLEDRTNVEFSWQALCSVKNCTVDLDNRIVYLENEFKSQTTTFGETETMTGNVVFSGVPVGKSWSEDAYVAAEIGEILLIGEYNLKGELKPVCYDYDDTGITAAKGLLVLRSEA